MTAPPPPSYGQSTPPPQGGYFPRKTRTHLSRGYLLRQKQPLLVVEITPNQVRCHSLPAIFCCWSLNKANRTPLPWRRQAFRRNRPTHPHRVSTPTREAFHRLLRLSSNMQMTATEPRYSLPYSPRGLAGRQKRHLRHLRNLLHLVDL